MTASNRLIVTGAAGFIGSQLALWLMNKGYKATELLLADEASYFNGRPCAARLREARIEFLAWQALPGLLEKNEIHARAIFHMGAISNTDESDMAKLRRHNVEYSQQLWQYCASKNVPFFYASSAATYGAGDLGFEDDMDRIHLLKPLNLYGQSKQEFDLWVLGQCRQGQQPSRWAGFKFFNVYGPGEEHKGSQRSVLWTAKAQLEDTGKIRLFKSHNPRYHDGEQCRDFVYVGDVCRVLGHFFETPSLNGIYNLGSGQARTFKDLAQASANALGLPCQIEYIPTPERLREHYQYFTQANLKRLRQASYTEPMTPLEEGIRLCLTKGAKYV